MRDHVIEGYVCVSVLILFGTLEKINLKEIQLTIDVFGIDKSANTEVKVYYLDNCFQR